MTHDSKPRLLFQGKHLKFLDRNGWEYVEHGTAPEAAMVVALTDRGEIVLTEEFRPAMNAFVIALPSGLVGDEGPEDAVDAARRELQEETGHAAARFRRLARGPGSAGQSSERITFFLAEGVRAAGQQAEHDRGKIRVHVVPVARLLAWARARERAGKIVDPKIYAGLFLAGRRSTVGRLAAAGKAPAPTAPSGRSSRRPSRARRGRSRSSKPRSRRRTPPRPRSGR
ncbi:MAG TPA: NUDIX hydrolase [Thermoanaerobaculia bacterium]|jgi:ADP-ribose pyrophosphatase